MKCYIMDDQYWENIYKWLSKYFPNINFPIKKNIKSPLDYADEVSNDDIILLDNYFPGETREEPLWAYFLEKLHKRKINCKIICISDYWKRLIDQYFEREQAYNDWIILWFETDKNAESVRKYLV